MNIFVLDQNPSISAELMCDKHVVKMIVESAQMLSTSHRYLDGSEYIDLSKNGRRLRRWNHWTDIKSSRINLFKSVMINHPCTSWTMKTSENYYWLAEHGIALCHEYTYRYNKIHSTQRLCEWLWNNAPEYIPSGTLTEFAQAMPDIYKIPGDAVSAYRAYYNGEKARFAKWTNRETPEWFTDNCLTGKTFMLQ